MGVGREEVSRHKLSCPPNGVGGGGVGRRVFMRLLSYNIHKGIGGQDRRYRLDRIIEVLEQRTGPDLFARGRPPRRTLRITTTSRNFSPTIFTQSVTSIR